MNKSTIEWDTMEFKLKLIRRDKEGQFILVQETVNQDDTTILSIHAPNSGAPNHIKKKMCCYI